MGSKLSYFECYHVRSIRCENVMLGIWVGVGVGEEDGVCGWPGGVGGTDMVS